MTYSKIKNALLSERHTWLITGVAGFIGSHLLEFLILHNQKVIGVDNLFTGNRRNLEEVRRLCPEQFDSQFVFIEGDIRDREFCVKLCSGVNYVLHHAAISSVPYSILNSNETNDVNISGTLNLIMGSEQSNVKRFVYASSSAVYGDGDGKDRTEEDPINLISPYGMTKYVNELSAKFYKKAVGLRYFNVFGPRQDPNGPYSAVIPKWISLLLSKHRPTIYGTGETTRDFCHVDNVVQANILACLLNLEEKTGVVFNVASGRSISLNELFILIRENIWVDLEPIYEDFRVGDILKSTANIDRAKTILGYVPMVSVKDGVKRIVRGN